MPIARGDRCPRKPTFEVKSGSRKLPLPPTDYARKHAPNVEPHFLVMGVQKSNAHKCTSSLLCPLLCP